MVGTHWVVRLGCIRGPDKGMSKSEWVKAYMAEHGCTKQAAYKAWGKSQPLGQPQSTSQPESKPESTDPLALPANVNWKGLLQRINDLECEVTLLKARVGLLEEPVLERAMKKSGIVRASSLGSSSWGQSDKLVPR